MLERMSILRRASRIPPRFLRSLVAPGRALLLARARLTLRRLPADLRLPRPRALILEPTLRCDQGCHFCFQQRPSDPRELDLDQVRRLLAVVGPRRIKLIGGEVLLR